MRKFFFFLALAMSVLTANATKYALYGEVPEGAVDLTTSVVAEAQGTATFADGVLTGAGLPGRINETSNYLRLSFSEATTMTLTDRFALHMVLQKAAGAAGKVQVSLCKNGWNAARISWEIENAAVAADEASDVVLKYGDRNTGNWNSYGETGMIGEVEYPAAEIMRISAAAEEQFTILSVYLESAFEGGDDPVIDPVLDGNIRYYLYRGNNSDALPEAEDLTCIDVRPTVKASVACNSAAQDASVTDFAQFTVNGSWCAIDHKPSASVTNTIDNTYYLVVRFKSNLGDGAFRSNQMRFNLANGANNFQCNNSDDETFNDERWHTVVLPLADAQGNKPAVYLEANQIAFQIHLNGNGESGKYIAVDYAYFTNDITSLDPGTAEDGEITPPEPPVLPEQDPQRIYLRKGSAVTPEDVTETADYSTGSYLTSEWWNCTPSSEFFGVSTMSEGDAAWWFNFQLKNNEPVDLTPVYSTWRLILRLKNGVVEEGTDRGLTIELGAPAANISFTTTFDEAESFVIKELPLAESLKNADHLAQIAAGNNVLVMSSGNNGQAGRDIEFDYIYLTNEPASDDPGTETAIDNVLETEKPVKFFENGQLYIIHHDTKYNVQGAVIK